MKPFLYFMAIVMLSSCSSARMIDVWVNKEYTNPQFKKVLIVGLTDNLVARKMFEEQLKAEFITRGIVAEESYNIFENKFTSSSQTEADIEKEVNRISNKGFDVILVSAVKGIDEKISYSGNNYRRDYYWRQFGRYYYLYQDIYFIEGYYTKYKVYHVEASLYNLKEDNDKSLIWVASYDIVDPKKISSTVANYVNAIMKSLEKEGIITKK